MGVTMAVHDLWESVTRLVRRRLGKHRSLGICQVCLWRWWRKSNAYICEEHNHCREKQYGSGNVIFAHTCIEGYGKYCKYGGIQFYIDWSNWNVFYIHSQCEAPLHRQLGSQTNHVCLPPMWIRLHLMQCPNLGVDIQNILPKFLPKFQQNLVLKRPKNINGTFVLSRGVKLELKILLHAEHLQNTSEHHHMHSEYLLWIEV